jgi:hypothetical protein
MEKKQDSQDQKEFQEQRQHEKDSDALPQSGSFFSQLLGHEPSKEQTARFNQIGKMTRLNDDDGMWYYIIINEFYDERLQKRLQEIDEYSEIAVRRTEEGIKKTIRRLMEDMSETTVRTFKEKLADTARKQTMWESLSSWGGVIGGLTAFFAVAFNAGYVMGSGQTPPWFHFQNRLEWIYSLFFWVPSGWIIFAGILPYALYTLQKTWSEVPKNFSKIFENDVTSISLPALGNFSISILKVLTSILVIIFSCFFFFSFMS